MICIGIDPGDRGAMVALDADGRLVASITADSRGGESYTSDEHVITGVWVRG